MLILSLTRCDCMYVGKTKKWAPGNFKLGAYGGQDLPLGQSHSAGYSEMHNKYNICRIISTFNNFTRCFMTQIKSLEKYKTGQPVNKAESIIFFEPSLKKSERPMNWLHRYSIIVTHIYIDSINLMWKIEYSISVRLISIRHSQHGVAARNCMVVCVRL